MTTQVFKLPARSKPISNAAKKRIQLQQNYTFNKNRERFYNYHKVERPTDVTLVNGFNTVIRKTEKISNSGVIWYPESMDYLFKLNGGSKQLLLYIIFFELELKTGEFSYTKLFVDHFLEYAVVFNVRPKPDTVYKHLRDLVKANIIQNIARQRYMLNPMIAGGNSKSQRDELIKEYSRKLAYRNHKCAIDDFYPCY